MNYTEVITLMKELVAQLGSQKAAADHLGISPQHLSDILHKTRRPGQEVLEKLGVRKVVSYEKIARK